jgi:hypothetical protein
MSTRSRNCPTRPSGSISRLALLTPLAAALAAPVGASAADPKEGGEGETVHVLVLRQGGAGSASTAQKYVDQVMARIGTLTGWQVSGKYTTTRAQAETYIEESKPEFGLVSLSAFLPMAAKYKLRPTGKAKVKGGGGGQYFIISKNQFDVAGCKGKKLASDHADDAKFVDNVVFADGLALGDFDLVKTKRSLQTLKAVIRDEAECALVDDAQVADLAHVEGGAVLRAVWSSREFPGMVMVEFPDATKDQAKVFAKNLPQICKGDGKKACTAAGIESLEAASADDFRAYLDAYNK